MNTSLPPLTEEQESIYKVAAMNLGLKAYELAVEAGKEPGADKKDIFIASIGAAYMTGVVQARRNVV